MQLNNSEQILKEYKKYGREIISNPEILNNKFKTINIQNIEDINTITPGTYVLTEKPSVELLKSLPYYKNSTSEVGIICFNNVWYIILGEENQLETPLPIEFKILKHLGVLQAHIHSHPAIVEINEYAHLPSDGDLDFCNSTIDQCQYVVSEKGILEIHNNYPRNIDITSIWSEWILKELKLNKEEFMRIGFAKLMTDFCKQKLDSNLLSWEMHKQISEIIGSKENTSSNKEL